MKIWDWIVKIAQTIAKGRDAGLWSEGHGPGARKDPKPFNKPHQPGPGRGQ